MPTIDKARCLVIAVLIFVLLFFKPVITGGDAYGYYVILEGIGKFHTLNLSNEQNYNEVTGIQYVYPDNATGKYVSKYPPGLALLSLPLYELSLALDRFRIFHIADEYFVKKRGDILIHQLSVTATTLLFLIISFYYTIKSMELLGIKKIFCAASLVFFGTPIMLYATQYSSYTHVMESGIFSAIIYYSLCKKHKTQAHLIGSLTGIITAVRYPDILLSSVNYDYLKDKKKLFSFIAGIAPFIILLMIYFKLQYGSYISTGYSSEKLHFYPVFLFNLLFGFDRGILFWTPLFFFSVFGLFLFGRDLRAKFMLPVIITVLFYSSWWAWDSAWGFGNRFFVVLFPLLCIGLGKLLDEKPTMKWAAYLASSYAFALSMAFLASTQHITDPHVLTSLVRFWQETGTAQIFASGIYDKMFLLRFLLGSPL